MTRNNRQPRFFELVPSALALVALQLWQKVHLVSSEAAAGTAPLSNASHAAGAGLPLLLAPAPSEDSLGVSLWLYGASRPQPTAVPA